MGDETHPDHVIATYREIADRFGLSSVRAARTKAKRAGWDHEPANHPYDPLRIRVPRASWNDAEGNKIPDADTDQSRDAKGAKRRDTGQQRHDTNGINGVDALIAPLREQLERERGRADAAQAEIEALREQVTELRLREGAAVARLEGIAGRNRGSAVAGGGVGGAARPTSGAAGLVASGACRVTHFLSRNVTNEAKRGRWRPRLPDNAGIWN